VNRESIEQKTKQKTRRMKKKFSEIRGTISSEVKSVSAMRGLRVANCTLYSESELNVIRVGRTIETISF
jgi:hypothetical protein